MIIILLFGKTAWTNLIKTVQLLQNIATKNLKNIFSQIWTILGSNYKVFIKFVHAILPKSRRMIIDYQLKKLLEKCLKTQLVGFGWADVLGFSPESDWDNIHCCANFWQHLSPSEIYFNQNHFEWNNLSIQNLAQ